MINDIENKTEGFVNNTSKKISKLLLDLNNDKQLQSLNSKDIENILDSKVKQFQKEINLLIEEEIKLRNKKTKPKFILIYDILKIWKNYQNFVSKVLHEVLIKLNFEEKDKIRIYTFNSEDYFSNIITSVKNLKKFKTECDGHIHFLKLLKIALKK